MAFGEINKELNKYPDPDTFHESRIVYFQVDGNVLTIRIAIYHCWDCWNIIPDDEHYLIVEGKFYGVIIKELYQDNAFEYFHSEVLSIEEKNGLMNINLLDESTLDSKYERYMSIKFTYGSYKWTALAVVNDDEWELFRNDEIPTKYKS